MTSVPTERGGLGAALVALAGRDLRLAARTPGLWLLPLAFFILAVVLLPLGTGTAAPLLQAVGPGALWLGMLLAAMLAQDGMFRGDRDDGTLDLLLTSPHPLAALVGVRIAVHWLLTGLPVVVLAPALAGAFALEAAPGWTLAATFLLGTPVVSLLGAVGAALTVGTTRGGLLLPLLVLPLCVPVLVIGTAAVRAATAGLPAGGHLLLLGALLVLAATFAPLAGAAGLRAAGAGG